MIIICFLKAITCPAPKVGIACPCLPRTCFGGLASGACPEFTSGESRISPIAIGASQCVMCSSCPDCRQDRLDFIGGNYVIRQLHNGQDIMKWAKKGGIISLPKYTYPIHHATYISLLNKRKGNCLVDLFHPNPAILGNVPPLFLFGN